MKIYHYPLEPLGVRTITLGISDKVLCAKQIGGVARLYVEKVDVPPEFNGPTTEPRKFALYPTGDLSTYALADDAIKHAKPVAYIDTVHFPAGGFVFHVYEVQ